MLICYVQSIAYQCTIIFLAILLYLSVVELGFVMGLRTKRFIRPWSTVLTTIETISFTVGQNISGSNVLTSRTKSFMIGQKVSETFYPWDKKFLKLLVPRIKFT